MIDAKKLHRMLYPRERMDAVEYLCEVAERKGLDPFCRQIILIRGSQVQTTIDGFRVIAARSGEYQGQTEPQWCGQDGIWQSVWVPSENPVASRIGAYRTGFREPCFGVANFSSFCPPGVRSTDPWGKMPAHMIAKVAESHALRKAFPELLSGLYTDDEMGAAEDFVQQAQEIFAPQPARKEPAKKPQPSPAKEPEPAKPSPDLVHKLCLAFAQFEAPKEELELYLGREIDAITLEDTEDLRSVYRYISEQENKRDAWVRALEDKMERMALQAND